MSKAFGLLVVVAACGGAKNSEQRHAVGTYIGGGSIMFGPSSCLYAGGAGVFQGDDAPSETPAKGPRFVFASGHITQTCGDQKTQIVAVKPTGAVIEGPRKVKAGTKSGLFEAKLVADGKPLAGEGALDWKLGKDCDGIATFDAVLGSQDTGGPDRTRTLIANTKGTCTISVGITTGSALHESFKPQAFQAEQRVTIE